MSAEQKPPAQNGMAERALLACYLQDFDPDTIAGIPPDAWRAYAAEAGALTAYAATVPRDKADMAGLYGFLEAGNRLAMCDTILGLSGAVATAACWALYREMVLESFRRRLTVIGAEAAREAVDGGGTAAEANAAFAAAQAVAGALPPVAGKSIAALWDVAATDISGIPTGYPSLQGALGGLCPGCLYVVAARTTIGKTTFALNLAAQTEAITAFYSLEMPALQLVRRLRLAGFAKDLPITIYDRAGIRVSDMAPPPDTMLVVLDYLQLVRPDREGRGVNREMEVADSTRRLKLLARDRAIPVVVLAQLNRSAEGGLPGLHHLRESGAIEQDADVVIFLHRDRDKEVGGVSETKCIVAKNRQGRCGSFDLAFEVNRQRMTEPRPDVPPTESPMPKGDIT